MSELSKFLVMCLLVGAFITAVTRPEGIKSAINSITAFTVSLIGVASTRDVTLPGGYRVGGLAK